METTCKFKNRGTVKQNLVLLTKWNRGLDSHFFFKVLNFFFQKSGTIRHDIIGDMKVDHKIPLPSLGSYQKLNDENQNRNWRHGTSLLGPFFLWNSLQQQKIGGAGGEKRMLFRQESSFSNITLISSLSL